MSNMRSLFVVILLSTTGKQEV